MRNGLWGFSGVIMGGLAALVSSFLVLGAFMLAFSEGESSLIRIPTPTAVEVSLATPLPPIAPSATNTSLPSPTRSYTSTQITSLTPTASETISLTPTSCPIPDGWIPYTVQHGETLNPLAARYGLSPQELADANCLTESQQVVPGLIIYVPGTAGNPPFVPPVQCTPRYDWTIYIVQAGDTLYNLALRLNMSVYQLQLANCLNSTYLRIGQRLYVPFYPGPPPIIPPPWPSPFPTNTEVPPTELPPPPPTEPVPISPDATPTPGELPAGL